MPGHHDRQVPLDRRGPAAGDDGRHRVAGGRGVGPGVLEHHAVAGQPIELGRGRARSSRRRPGDRPAGCRSRSAARFRLAGTRGGTVCSGGGRRSSARRSTLSQSWSTPSSGQSWADGVDGLVPVVAVAAAQQAGITVAVEVQRRAHPAEQRAHQAGLAGRRLARALAARPPTARSAAPAAARPERCPASCMPRGVRRRRAKASTSPAASTSTTTLMSRQGTNCRCLVQLARTNSSTGTTMPSAATSAAARSRTLRAWAARQRHPERQRRRQPPGDRRAQPAHPGRTAAQAPDRQEHQAGDQQRRRRGQHQQAGGRGRRLVHQLLGGLPGAPQAGQRRQRPGQRRTDQRADQARGDDVQGHHARRPGSGCCGHAVPATAAVATAAAPSPSSTQAAMAAGRGAPSRRPQRVRKPSTMTRMAATSPTHSPTDPHSRAAGNSPTTPTPARTAAPNPSYSPDQQAAGDAGDQDRCWGEDVPGACERAMLPQVRDRCRP